MNDHRKRYFIYILECSNNSYYTGYTTNIVRRFEEHCRGTTKCKYTRSFPPLRIAVCWEIQSDLSIALEVEASIKKLSKNAKLELITNPHRLITLKSHDCGEAMLTIVDLEGITKKSEK